MKKFYTASDVEFYAARGERVIQVNPEDVITSVAREEAARRGIQFVAAGSAAGSMPFTVESSAVSMATAAPMTVAPTAPVYQTPIVYPEVKALPYKGLLSEAEIDRWREEFPILKNVAHLGNCSQSAQSKRVLGRNPEVSG